MDEIQLKIITAINRIRILEVKKRDEVALKSFLLGAGYAFIKANELRYNAEWRYQEMDIIIPDVEKIGKSLQEKKQPENDKWLSGFYFNSAIMRVSAVNQRLFEVYQKKHGNPIEDTRKTVNDLKHRLIGDMEGNKKLSMEDAIRDFEKVISCVEKHLTKKY